MTEQLHIGLIKCLEKKKGIVNIELQETKPADRHTVLTWEQRNTSLLPDDLKSFYLTSNGFDLTWSVKMNGSVYPVGKMHINPILQLTKIGGFPEKPSLIQPSLVDLELDSDNEDTTEDMEKPSLTGNCRLYELDSCDGYGKVCLIFKSLQKGPLDAPFGCARIADPVAEVWFLDRALRLHFLADSFLSYYRLMLMHMGLPHWQYAFTDIGLSAQSKQWFNMYSPLRLDVDSGLFCEAPQVRAPSYAAAKTLLDYGKVFRGRSDKKKAPVQSQSITQTQNMKKKLPMTNVRSQTSMGTKPPMSQSMVKLK